MQVHSVSEFWFHQIKHGVYDGLDVHIIRGENCVEWMRYSNGMAIDKWLYWSPYGDKLMIWAKFKKSHMMFQNIGLIDS